MEKVRSKTHQRLPSSSVSPIVLTFYHLPFPYTKSNFGHRIRKSRNLRIVNITRFKKLIIHICFCLFSILVVPNVSSSSVVGSRSF